MNLVFFVWFFNYNFCAEERRYVMDVIIVIFLKLYTCLTECSSSESEVLISLCDDPVCAIVGEI